MATAHKNIVIGQAHQGSVNAKTAYESSVIARAMQRAGNNPHLKGHIHEVLIQDARNVRNLLSMNGASTQLTKSTTAGTVDLVISEFTLPTLEACLSLRPEHIVLIASDGETFAQQARHLQGLLHERLEGSRVEILSHASTGEHLGGDHITANQAWLAAHLVPRLQEVAHQGGICAANLTGGTKAMALALAACHDWQRLDYQPLGNKPMQSVRASHQPHYQAQPSTERHLHDAQPLDIGVSSFSVQ